MLVIHKGILTYFYFFLEFHFRKIVKFGPYICKDDPFEHEIPLYTEHKTFKELPLVEINDKTHKLFYNYSAYAKAADEEGLNKGAQKKADEDAIGFLKLGTVKREDIATAIGIPWNG